MSFEGGRLLSAWVPVDIGKAIGYGIWEFLIAQRMARILFLREQHDCDLSWLAWSLGWVL
jgi:hypothetical protein